MNLVIRPGDEPHSCKTAVGAAGICSAVLVRTRIPASNPAGRTKPSSGCTTYFPAVSLTSRWSSATGVAPDLGCLTKAPIVGMPAASTA